jgi:hypothetical protein
MTTNISVIGWFAHGLATMALGMELPAAHLANLRSSDFKDREVAQSELLAWSRERPEGAMDELLRQSRVADDPEVRERCTAVLREMVTDQYLKEGEGFIGIELRDETQLIPGDQRVRSCIRVAQVQADSPGKKAGLQQNDLIVALNGETWYDVAASVPFREKIMGFKPQSSVKLSILRGEDAVEVNVTLGRRPAVPAGVFFNGGGFDPESMERAAREAYFRRWLKQKKLAK